MFLGIITYLDTVNGFKMDYSAFSEQRETQSYVFSSVGATLWGIFRLYGSLGIITYPRHLNKIIWGIIGEKTHNLPCGLMCSLWCADFPHRPVVLFGFSEERV